MHVNVRLVMWQNVQICLFRYSLSNETTVREHPHRDPSLCMEEGIICRIRMLEQAEGQMGQTTCADDKALRDNLEFALLLCGSGKHF
mmetsp:Transcript_1484/g.2043  ORF Transcript_1484/g.2043 Transcript_1484/m.2043 type:complete len:87 (+) Transcript_1484:138-398(+)